MRSSSKYASARATKSRHSVLGGNQNFGHYSNSQSRSNTAYFVSASIAAASVYYWATSNSSSPVQCEEQQAAPLPSLTAPFVNVTGINTGTLQLKESAMIRGGAENVVHRVSNISYLIEHPEHGPLLFDLGFNKELGKRHYGSLHQHAPFFDSFSIQIKPYFESLAQCLEKQFGYKPEEIRKIVISHYHWDHCGDVDDFPNASFIMGHGINSIINDVCVVCSRQQRGFFGFELPIHRNIEEVQWDKNVTIGPFEGCHDLYGDGSVYIVDGDGHVPGHIMLIAKHEKGWILLAADGVYDPKSYQGETPVAKGDYNGKPVDHDPDKAFQTICRIHQFYKMNGTMVRPAHVKVDEIDFDCVI